MKKEEKLDVNKIASELLCYIVNDKKLSAPVYMKSIKTEENANKLGLYPIVYVWNENRRKGSFSVSVNGKGIAHLLETEVPRKHPQFLEIRDEVMHSLNDMAVKAVVATCEKMNSLPSDIFRLQKNLKE